MSKDALAGPSSGDLRGDLRRRSTRGGAITVSAQAVRFILQLASTALMLRLLTPDQVGVFAQFVVIATFANIFHEAGLGAATIQARTINQSQVSTLFWLNTTLGLAAAMLAAAMGPLVAWAFSEPRLVGVALACSPMFIIGAMAAQHQAMLQRSMRFMPLAIADVGSLAIGAASGIHAAAIGMGYWAPVVLAVTSVAVRTAILWLLSGWRPGRPGRLAEVRSMLGFGAGLTGASIFNIVRTIAPNAVLGVVSTSTVVALFDRAYHLLVIPIERLLPPIRTVAVPTLAKLQDDHASLVRAHTRLLRLALHAALPASVLSFAAADEVVAIMAGPQWSEAVGLFRALAPLAATQVVASLCIWLLTATGRARVLLMFSGANAALSVASVLAGAPWGAVGVALAFSLGAVAIRTPLLVAMTLRATPLTLGPLLKTIAFPVVLAVVLSGGLFLLRPFISELGGGALGALAIHVAAVTVGWLAFQGRAMLAEFRWLKTNLRKGA
ncbi:MAG: lipopolysaccharide biosynthesis protein [Phycisphaerales bacterium JB060]